MNIFETLSVTDYIIAVLGVLALILGIVQLCAKRCIGVAKIKQFTEESVSKFTVVSSIIYIIGGILIVAAPLAVKYINSQNFGFSLPTQIPNWTIVAVIIFAFIAQTSILKRK